MPPEIETADVRTARHLVELRVLELLRQLCLDTGLDLDRVQVLTVVDVAQKTGEPQVVPYAVKIVLCV